MVSKAFSKNGNLLKTIYFSANGKEVETHYGKRDGLNFIEKFENGRFIEAKSYYKNWDESTLAYAKSENGTETFYKYTKNGVEILTRTPNGDEMLSFYDSGISKIVNSTIPTDVLKWKNELTKK